MKKVGCIFLLFVLIFSSFVLAQTNQDEKQKVDDAYQCLDDQLANKTTDTLSLQDSIFATLATGYDKKLIDSIESEKASSNCWPKSSCTIKDTAQVLLAYDKINRKSEDIKKYLLSQNSSSPDLVWYLQTDIINHKPATCTITYDNDDFKVEIGEDMKLSSGAGNCLSLSESGYWLQIRSTCFDKKFQVSCDEDFITSLLYQKQGSSTIFVSSETHSAPSSGTTEEKVESQCFKVSGSCDYEGTLWAAMALQAQEVDISSFLPYLLALSPDNVKLFPSSFLYIFTSGEDQYSEVTQSQKQSGFWEAPNTKYNKFYDTSLGMLSLKSTTAAELDRAKSYLLSVQTPDGCWNNNNIRDTAFVLYAGWPRGSTGGSGDGGAAPPESCEAAGFFCSSKFDCIDAGGQLLDNYACSVFSQTCCSVSVTLPTCTSQNGRICASNERCSGTTVSSSEGSCCLSTCQPAQQRSACEVLGGVCSSSCNSNEQKTTDSCSSVSDVCCVVKQSSGSWTWVIILIILIILVALAIIFRKRLQLWWFAFKNRKRRSGPPSSPMSPRPSFGPPGFPSRPMMPRPLPPQARRPSAKVDKEMEETLRKLREMSS